MLEGGVLLINIQLKIRVAVKQVVELARTCFEKALLNQVTFNLLSG